MLETGKPERATGPAAACWLFIIYIKKWGMPTTDTSSSHHFVRCSSFYYYLMAYPCHYLHGVHHARTGVNIKDIKNRASMDYPCISLPISIH